MSGINDEVRQLPWWMTAIYFLGWAFIVIAFLAMGDRQNKLDHRFTEFEAQDFERMSDYEQRLRKLEAEVFR